MSRSWPLNPPVETFHEEMSCGQSDTEKTVESVSHLWRDRLLFNCASRITGILHNKFFPIKKFQFPVMRGWWCLVANHMLWCSSCHRVSGWLETTVACPVGCCYPPEVGSPPGVWSRSTSEGRRGTCTRPHVSSRWMSLWPRLRRMSDPSPG